MITIRRFLEAIRDTFANPRGLGLFIGLYALLLISLYLFVSTREATIAQVFFTFVLLLLIPAEFFLLQASILTRERPWRAVALNAAKLFLVTIPIVILGYALWALLNKWQLHHPAPRPPFVFPAAAAKPQPLHWPSLLFATARGLLFGVLLPLATIHFWIEVASHKAVALFNGRALTTLKRFGNVLSRAFTPAAVLTYALGLVFFVLIPYVLLFINPSPKGTKTDFAIFILRLVLVFGFTLFGWIVTLNALSKGDAEKLEVSAGQVPAPAEAAA